MWDRSYWRQQLQQAMPGRSDNDTGNFYIDLARVLGYGSEDLTDPHNHRVRTMAAVWGWEPERLAAWLTPWTKLYAQLQLSGEADALLDWLRSGAGTTFDHIADEA